VCEREREIEYFREQSPYKKFLTKEEEAGKTFAMKIFTKSL
jgi:hypothetical protein